MSNEDDKRETRNTDEGENDVIHVARTPTSPTLFIELEHAREYRQARGLGAGHTGAAIFYLQRLTALALIPLTIWFVVSVVCMSTSTQVQARAWLAWPLNAALIGLFVVIALRHAVIGICIILEDYVRHVQLRSACVLGVQAIAVVLGVATVVALICLVHGQGH